MRRTSKHGLTQSSLFYLSCRQGKHPKQFHHYLDQNFSQSKGDPGEDLETAKVTFEMSKELDNRIIIVADLLRSLKIGVSRPQTDAGREGHSTHLKQETNTS